MTSKTAPDTTNPKELANLSTRRPRMPQPPPFPSEAARDQWYRAQDKLAEAFAAARAKYPPGSKLSATTARGIPRRGRAGVVFGERTRTEVVVVDLTDAELATLRAGGDVDGLSAAEAAKIRATPNAVTPTGAKAIADDDGLIVFAAGGDDAKFAAEADAKDRRIAELEAELQNARAKISELTRRASGAGGDGRPERLAKGKEAAGGDDFGGDATKVDPKARG